jgi:hypothetical protein
LSRIAGAFATPPPRGERAHALPAPCDVPDRQDHHNDHDNQPDTYPDTWLFEVNRGQVAARLPDVIAAV